MDLPQRFGRYMLDARIGAGGMAEVFKARLVGDGPANTFQKQVCIKRILPQLCGAPGFADMLRDEATLAARLTHQNIVQTIDFGDVGGVLFIAMEYVDGTTLGRVLQERAKERLRVPLGHALQIGVAVCRALQHAHTARVDGRPLEIIHRDVSPQNVLLGHDGAIKLADFGVARANERLTRTVTELIKGKTGYMAPEQALGEEIDQRVDQFAAGVLLWETLTGRRLFPGANDLLVLDAVARCVVAPPSSVRGEIPRTLDAVILRALAKDRAQRYPDMAALEEAIAEALFVIAKRPADIDVRALVKETLAPVEHTAPVRAAQPEIAGAQDAATVDDAPPSSGEEDTTAMTLAPRPQPRRTPTLPTDPSRFARVPPAPRSGPPVALRSPPEHPSIDAAGEPSITSPAAPDGTRFPALAAAVAAGVVVGIASVLFLRGTQAAPPPAPTPSGPRVVVAPSLPAGAGPVLATPILAVEPAVVAGAAPLSGRDEPRALLRVADAAFAGGDVPAAVAAWRRYLALAPDGAEAARVRALVAQHGAASAPP